MRHTNFSKTRLSATISMLLGAISITPVASAQEATAETQSEDVEIIQVSGIRGSLARSQDLKRGSSGVVDAISAEDMGKFPDTNLAESLQRITGVSVSRSNGEGSEITVRGFGPDFNLVTLNGRQMAGTGFNRSFRFENLSSEGVSSLEVYKTARADIPTGGLGATVNIVTARPLSSPGERYSFMAKGIHDTTNEVNDDVTPEFAGIYSNTFSDDRFGISANFSYHRRDFRRQSANVQGWKATTTGTFIDADGNESQFFNASPLPDDLTDAVDNRATDANGNPLPIFTAINPETGEEVATAAHFLPQDLNYSIEDVERERFNALVTFQFAATDNLIITLDHTISQTTNATDGIGWGIWNGDFGGNANGYELDANGTAIYYNSSGNDQSFTTNRVTDEVDSAATGLNIEWVFSDSLTFEFDAHTSSSETDNTLDDGLQHSALMILGSQEFSDKEYDFRNGGDVPIFNVNWNNGTSEVNPSDIGANLGIFTATPGESEITQYNFSGEWYVDTDFGLTDVKFGFGYNEQSLTGTSRVSQPAGYNFNTAVFPDGMFTRLDLNSIGFLDQFDFGAGLAPNYTYTYDIGEAISRSIAFFDESNPVGDTFDITDYTSVTNSEIEEETTSFYLSTKWEFEVKDYYVDVNVGFRYEETDVVSPGETRIIDRVIWNGGSEWRTEFQGDTVIEDFEGSYDLFLPMIDARVDLTDDITTRLSWGKTITRPTLGQLLGGLNVTSFPAVGSRTGSRGNPNLKPFESTNLDLSFEWYYDDASYAAIGLFWKDVEDWIDTSQVILQFDGVHDIFQGQRWNQAEAAIVARGEQATSDAIYNEIIANGVGVEGSSVIPDPATDPLIDWRVTSPENVDERSTNGIEVAIQHVFGDTGFGAGINATFVDGDVEYDRFLLTTQAVLPGLSDSANFQVFYEDDDLSVKITAAWRDEYLIGQGQDQGSDDVPPQFFESYLQWDFSVNYNINENLTVFLEGVNINEETERTFGRFEEQFLSAAQFGARYALGVRYSFK